MTYTYQSYSNAFIDPSIGDEVHWAYLTHLSSTVNEDGSRDTSFTTELFMESFHFLGNISKTNLMLSSLGNGLQVTVHDGNSVLFQFTIDDFRDGLRIQGAALGGEAVGNTNYPLRVVGSTVPLIVDLPGGATDQGFGGIVNQDLYNITFNGFGVIEGFLLLREGIESYGTNGNDLIVGFDQNTNTGQLFHDTLFGMAGDDGLVGNAGDDNLFGGAGRDNLSGNEGDDVINGGDGLDFLYGNEGDDFLYGGQGEDQQSGWTGNDTYFYEIGDGTQAESAGEIVTEHVGHGLHPWAPSVKTRVCWFDSSCCLGWRAVRERSHCVAQANKPRLVSGRHERNAV